MILSDIIGSLDAGHAPMVLTEKRNHLEFLAERLTGFTENLIVLCGGATPKQRGRILRALKTVPGSEERLVLATGRYVGYGLDDPRLDTLLLTMPVSWGARSSSMRGTCSTRIPGSRKCKFSTRQIEGSRFSPACSPNVPPAIGHWDSRTSAV